MLAAKPLKRVGRSVEVRYSSEQPKRLPEGDFYAMQRCRGV